MFGGNAEKKTSPSRVQQAQELAQERGHGGLPLDARVRKARSGTSEQCSPYIARLG